LPTARASHSIGQWQAKTGPANACLMERDARVFPLRVLTKAILTVFK